MITDIEDYFAKGCGRCARFDTPDCSVHRWSEGLYALRTICCDAGLAETVKWGQPCFTHAGRNVALIGAFRDSFSLSFFNAALLEDPNSLRERQGPNTKHPNVIRFFRNDQVACDEDAIKVMLKAAMGLAETDARAPRDESEPDYPEELATALAGDPELAEAFDRLTPGRRRSYVIALSSAKQSTTRARRIAGYREKILSGKGANER